MLPQGRVELITSLCYCYPDCELVKNDLASLPLLIFGLDQYCMTLLHLEVVEEVALVKQHSFGVEFDTFLTKQLHLALDILSTWNCTPIAFESANVLGEPVNS